MKQINNQAGFTLIEILMASVVIVFGLLAMGTFLGSQVNHNSKNERKTIALTLAQQKIEELRNTALIAGVSSANNGTDTLLASTTGAGDFTRTWTIDDVTNPNLDLVRVIVDWDAGRGTGTSQIELTTQLSN